MTILRAPVACVECGSGAVRKRGFCYLERVNLAPRGLGRDVGDNIHLVHTSQTIQNERARPHDEGSVALASLTKVPSKTALPIVASCRHKLRMCEK